MKKKSILFSLLFCFGSFLGLTNKHFELEYTDYDTVVDSKHDEVNIYILNIIDIPVFITYENSEKIDINCIINLYTKDFNKLPPGYKSPLILSTNIIEVINHNETITINLSGKISNKKENLDLVIKTIKNKLDYEKVIFLKEGILFYSN